MSRDEKTGDRTSEATHVGVIDAARELVEYVEKNKEEGDLTPSHHRHYGVLRGALAVWGRTNSDQEKALDTDRPSDAPSRAARLAQVRACIDAGECQRKAIIAACEVPRPDYAPNEWGCEARQRLGVARGALESIIEDRFPGDDVYEAGHDALERTAMPSPCSTEQLRSALTEALALWAETGCVGTSLVNGLGLGTDSAKGGA